MKVSACAIFAAFAAAALSADSGDSNLKFEISDVHVSHPSPVQSLAGPYLRGGRYEARYATMVDLVTLAYDVPNEKVYGGPKWLQMKYYDIIAKPPAGASKDKLRIMLRNLLAERFELKVHPGAKPMPAFALIAGKHPALKQSAASTAAGCKYTPPERPKESDPQNAMPLFLNQCRAMTMEALARGFNDLPNADMYLNGRSVVDKTGLEGAFDFDIAYNGRFNNRGGVPTRITTLADSLDKLGLRLEPTTVAVPGIIVDSVNEAPAPNQPGAAQALHTLVPTEFDVAAISPTPPDFTGARFQVQAGGRINLQGVSAKLLIEQSFNIADEMLLNSPPWLDSDRWDIVAKALAVESADPRQQGGDIDFDAAMVMIQNLLKDRFKLTYHYEQRPIDAYTLLAGKNKMKAADPESRIFCNEGPGADGKDPRNEHPGLSRLVTCQNMSMDTFAGELQRLAGGWIHVPVLNSSKLEGGWDFTINFSTIGQFRNGSRLRESDKPESDLPDVISLPEAVSRMMGLRLELQKRPVNVMVIDHIERKPTD
jgi:uncharacterized protein (TIGR03435 family)